MKAASAKVENFKVDFEGHQNVEVLEVVKSFVEKMDIQDAKILVSGGRGMGCPKTSSFSVIWQTLLAAEVSSSRACVDRWLG